MKVSFFAYKAMYPQLFKGRCSMKSVKFTVSGGGNSINLCMHNTIEKTSIKLGGNNNSLTLGDGVKLRNLNIVFEGDNNSIVIGAGTYIGSNCEFAVTEGSQLLIGENCLIAHSCVFRTTDSHKIFVLGGDKPINPVENIVIGKRCWIGLQSIILKGSHLPDDCIVGARSMVTRKTKADSYSIVAGQPAKIIKTNVRWA